MEQNSDANKEQTNTKKRRASASAPTSPNQENTVNPLSSSEQMDCQQEIPQLTPPEHPQEFSEPRPIPTKSNKNKKYKKATTLQKPLNLTGIEAIFSNDPVQYPLKFDDFKLFLELCMENGNFVANAQKITEDIDILIRTIEEIYPHLPDKIIKSKCTKIIKTLKKHLKLEESEISSNLSTSSQELFHEPDFSPQEKQINKKSFSQ